jgi:hypothetical protein
MAEAMAGDDPLAGMSPVDLLKLRTELASQQRVSPEQRAANLKQTGWEVLSVIPGPANVISAMDAWDSGKDAVQAFGAGDGRRGLLASAMAGLSGFGAVTGLPTSKMAGRVAKDAGRTVFSGAGPVDDWRYVRRTRGKNPDTGAGYMMFLDSKGDLDTAVDGLSIYGKNAWVGKPVNPVLADDIADDVFVAMQKRGMLDEYQFDRESLGSAIAPRDIVTSAEFWDDPKLVEMAWEDVLDPKGHRSVITPDGMILFDPSGVKPHGG